MRLFFSLAAGLALVLLLAAVLLLPGLAPWRDDIPLIEAQFRERTGLKLRIAGPVAFSLLPSPSLQAEDVALGEVDGPLSLTARRLDLSLGVSALWGGQMQITDLGLEAPHLTLRLDAGGLQPLREALTLGGAEVLAARLQDGRLTLTDAVSGYTLEGEGLQASLDPVGAEGGGPRLEGAFTLLPPQAGTTAGARRLGFALSDPPGPGGSLAVQGIGGIEAARLTLTLPPVPAESFPLSLTLPAPADLSLTGRLGLGPDSLTLGDLSVSAGSLTGQGAMRVPRRPLDAAAPAELQLSLTGGLDRLTEAALRRQILALLPVGPALDLSLTATPGDTAPALPLQGLPIRRASLAGRLTPAAESLQISRLRLEVEAGPVLRYAGSVQRLEAARPGLEGDLTLDGPVRPADLLALGALPLPAAGWEAALTPLGAGALDLSLQGRLRRPADAAWSLEAARGRFQGVELAALAVTALPQGGRSLSASLPALGLSPDAVSGLRAGLQALMAAPGAAVEQRLILAIGRLTLEAPVPDQAVTLTQVALDLKSAPEGWAALVTSDRQAPVTLLAALQGPAAAPQAWLGGGEMTAAAAPDLLRLMERLCPDAACGGAGSGSGLLAVGEGLPLSLRLRRVLEGAGGKARLALRRWRSAAEAASAAGSAPAAGASPTPAAAESGPYLRASLESEALTASLAGSVTGPGLALPEGRYTLSLSLPQPVALASRLWPELAGLGIPPGPLTLFAEVTEPAPGGGTRLDGVQAELGGLRAGGSLHLQPPAAGAAGRLPGLSGRLELRQLTLPPGTAALGDLARWGRLVAAGPDPAAPGLSLSVARLAGFDLAWEQAALQLLPEPERQSLRLQVNGRISGGSAGLTLSLPLDPSAEGRLTLDLTQVPLEALPPVAAPRRFSGGRLDLQAELTGDPRRPATLSGRAEGVLHQARLQAFDLVAAMRAAAETVDPAALPTALEAALASGDLALERLDLQAEIASGTVSPLRLTLQPLPEGVGALSLTGTRSLDPARYDLSLTASPAPGIQAAALTISAEGLGARATIRPVSEQAEERLQATAATAAATRVQQAEAARQAAERALAEERGRRREETTGLRAELETLKAEAARLTRQLSGLEADLDAARTARRQAEEGLRLAADQATRSRAAQEEIARLAAELEAERAETARAREALAAAEERIRAAEARAEEAAAREAALRQTMQRELARIQALEERLQGVDRPSAPEILPPDYRPPDAGGTAVTPLQAIQPLQPVAPLAPVQPAAPAAPSELGIAAEPLQPLAPVAQPPVPAEPQAQPQFQPPAQPQAQPLTLEPPPPQTGDSLDSLLLDLTLPE